MQFASSRLFLSIQINGDKVPLLICLIAFATISYGELACIASHKLGSSVLAQSTVENLCWQA